MNKFRFKCSDETVKNIYSLFDTLVKDDNVSSKILKSHEDVTVTKGFYGDCSLTIKEEHIELEEGILDNIKARGIFDGNEDYTDIFMLKELYLNKGYFFKQEDISRCTEDYGIVGDRKVYSNRDIVFAPKSPYDFKDIAEVREEYKNLVPSSYKKAVLPPSFKNIMGNEEYKEFFKKEIKNSFTVNRLFERNGAVFCRNRVTGYKALDYLEGVESDFYNNLLEVIVGMGKPVHSVYFYSDLNWSCILYRESKEAKGEYDIVLK